VGNAPFHPVDFTILNQRVSAPRLGHAYSAHGISGNLGWAAAPVFLVGLTALTGSWRWAYVGAALWGLLMLVVVWRQHAALTLAPRQAHLEKLSRGTDEPARSRADPHRAEDPAEVQEHPLAFMKLPILWLCFGFFFFATAAFAAIQSFTGPALQAMYGLPLTATATVVTGFMLAGAVGMVLGGFLSARVPRLELTIGLAMSSSALLMLVVASGQVDASLAIPLVVAAGLGSGLAGPSRDMLIRRATPQGATGRVYGTVYSGLDAGLAVAAPIFGWLLDRGQPAGIFVGAALAWFLAMVAATSVGRRLGPT
jgi:MFS family permease